MGRPGKLNINIDSVRETDGDKAMLRAVKDSKGGGHTGAMTGAMVATSLIFWPAAPLFLFIHGKDITIPEGTEITAFVQGDQTLDMVKFQPVVVAAPVVAVATADTSAKVTIDASIPNCDIEIDGNFAGNTPSTLDLPIGKHNIAIAKAGYTTWARTMNIVPGDVHLNADMVKAN
jgi:hypothetical protein